jgi:chromosome segregation protein
LRIKKIELVGFKSFKDRTVIQFDAGITGIVGPNGCGKSNIVDALVWVMGDMSAKDLRASTMTDVIFAGAEGYAPMGMAEVSLTLENDGGPFPSQYLKHSEIMVTRKLHRDGESEYYINKEPARLKDIQEIFMDTGAGAKGFSIIQQGMIGRIITAKPEDRKHLIEEAAGITKFKMRKRESQRKLQTTEGNLLRLQDIVGELKRQIDYLQRQAQKAERYREVKRQIEDLDLWLSSNQFVDLKKAAEEAQKIFQEAQSFEIDSEARLAEIGAELETLRLQATEQEKQIEVLQTQNFEAQSSSQKKEYEIQELKMEIEQARRSEQMTGSMISEQQARKEILEKDIQKLNTEYSDVLTVKNQVQNSYETKKSIFDEGEARIQEMDQELTQQRREFIAVGQTEATVSTKIQGLEVQIEDTTAQLAKQQEVSTELASKKEEFETRRRKIGTEYDKERQLQIDLSSDVDSFEANKKVLNEQISEKRNQVDEYKDALNETASRLYGLENLQQNFEGFEEGVKNIMLWQKTKQTEISADGSVYFSPVAEVVEVPSEYELAMEAALGVRLQMLFSQDQEATLQAVDYLKQNSAGRTSFLIDGSSEPAIGNAPSGEGVLEMLHSVVSAPENFKPSVDKVLSRVAVVDGIRTALRLRSEYPGWTFVTKEGDALTADGILTGGSAKDVESGLLKRRREIKELSQKKEEWAGKHALASQALKKLEEQLANVTHDFEGAQKRKSEQEIKVTEFRKDLERAETEVSQAEYALHRNQLEVQKISDQLANLTAKKETLLSEHVTILARKNSLAESTVTLEQDLENLKLSFESSKTETNELRVQLAQKEQELQGMQGQLDLLNRSLDELNGQLSKYSEESQKYSIVLTDSQYKLEERKVEFEKSIQSVEETKKRLAECKNTYEILHAQVVDQDSQLQKLQTERNQRMMTMNESQLKFEQAKMKETNLLDQIRERYMLDLSLCFEQHLDKPHSMETAEVQLKELKEKLGRMGEVNLSSINEFEDTQKRYEFLTQQQTDLNESKAQLNRVIDRINKICSRRFTETFDLVNDRFTKVFPVLFGGGEARLQLIEDPEKQEMGIEIIAKPPGKKMQNVSLLSGGEKALTAVSLVFSIFLVKPSPYCLLDEVDAPLDDANVYRFNDLVREMAKRSQIIVVTHNKHTMEVAGKLYGVTMQERGVSTMVSVNLQDL